MTSSSRSRIGHLALATASFLLCFAGWGLMSAYGPVIKTALGLTATQAALLIAAPVLLGSLARLPMGLLADRFGGRLVFTVLMVGVAAPIYLVPHARGQRELLVVGLLLGLAGSAFSIGVSYVSRWTPPERQGTALGLYGLGTIGQGLVIFFGPLLAARLGWPAVFHGVALALAAWGIRPRDQRDATATTPPSAPSTRPNTLPRPRAAPRAQFVLPTLCG